MHRSLYSCAVALTLVAACKPHPKPPAPGDTTAVDTTVTPSPGESAAVDSTGLTPEPDSAGMWNYDDLDTVRQDSSQHATIAYPLNLAETVVVVDTAVDTTTDSGYTWVTHTETRVTTATDTAVTVLAVDTIAVPEPPVATGAPYGEFGLYADNQHLKAYSAAFTMAQSSVAPSAVCSRVSAARSGHLTLVMTIGAGAHSQYLSGGKFDLSKWKTIVAKYNTATNRNCIAAGVSDGTILANIMMDEPEHSSWGGVMTKPLLDQMAVFLKNYFPTLPVGVGHGPPAYFNFHPEQTYTKLDFAYYQYSSGVRWKGHFDRGDVEGWRNGALAQAAKDHVQPAFGMNVLDGGLPDRDGNYNCSGTNQYGVGTYFPTCRMTPDQVRTYGGKLLGYGCYLNQWRWDDDYNRMSAVQSAFQDLRSKANSTPRTACKL